jgi:predicted nucleic acid-binding protein
MTADEIREQFLAARLRNAVQTQDDIAIVQTQVMAEIAAQLAELKEVSERLDQKLSDMFEAMGV